MRRACSGAGRSARVKGLRFASQARIEAVCDCAGVPLERAGRVRGRWRCGVGVHKRWRLLACSLDSGARPAHSPPARLDRASRLCGAHLLRCRPREARPGAFAGTLVYATRRSGRLSTATHACAAATHARRAVPRCHLQGPVGAATRARVPATTLQCVPGGKTSSPRRRQSASMARATTNMAACASALPKGARRPLRWRGALRHPSESAWIVPPGALAPP